MNKYNTKITSQTCSCPDWIETRKKYPFNDPRRLCKHLINALDIDNLPSELFKFKEDLSYYQNEGWGFKRDFDEIVEISEFTLLGTFGWINVYDENAIKYGVRKETFSNEIFWANNKKPKNFSLIEEFFNKESEKLPLPLEKEEYEIIINFIKEVLPQKKDYYISIETSQFLPNDDEIIYAIWEPKLTTEENNRLEQKILQKYDENKFCIYEALTVTKDFFIVKMENGTKYKLKRDYQYVKQLKKARELKIKLEKEKQENIWKEELNKKRNIAKEKGVVLTEDYKGTLYRIQNFYNFPINSSWDKLTNKRDKALSNYDTLNNLIKENSIDVSTAKFNKTLVELGFIIKESSLNLNNYILKDNGLDFGINYIKESPYMHEKIPDWYKTHIFNFESLKLEAFDFYQNIKMTTALFEKEKFTDLYDIVNNHIKINNHTKLNKSKKQIEREKWLRHVDCPKCGEKNNIHKKDIRKRSEYSIQRFYCNECNSMFQIKVDELEQKIQEYELTPLSEIGNTVAEKKEECNNQSKTKEKNNKYSLLNKFFRFFKS